MMISSARLKVRHALYHVTAHDHARIAPRLIGVGRGVMAKQLVYASAESSETYEERPVDVGPMGVKWKPLKARKHLPVRKQDCLVMRHKNSRT